MIPIPFFDHRPGHDSISDELQKAFLDFLSNDMLILGHEVEMFEKEFSTYQSCAAAAGVNSGLDALILALKVLGIGPGDEVIVPANTYIATWNAIHLVGAIPVPVDADSATMNILPGAISHKINSRTKAIIPVHLYGLPCNMSDIMQLANKNNLKVIEDNAQSVGAIIDGNKTGSWGHINATSFYPTKNLGALGDGGMVTSDDEALISKVKVLRSYGSNKSPHTLEIGINSRLDELHAAFLRIKLSKLDSWLQERKDIALKYREGLAGIGDIVLPLDDPAHTYHLFVIRTAHRDALASHLRQHQIATLAHYPVPPHLQPAYRFLSYHKGDFPVTESIADSCLSLPLYYGFNCVDEVIENIRGYFRKT